MQVSVYLIIIIILLTLLIILTLILIGFIVFLFIKKLPLVVANQSQSKQELQKGPVQSQYFCINHTEIHSTGICNICERPFCTKCLKEYDKLFFCFEHSMTYLENKWEVLDTVMSDPNDSTVGEYLCKFKEDIWKEDIPSYIVTHYRINVEHDYIESFTSLYVNVKIATELSNRLENIKKSYQAPLA